METAEPLTKENERYFCEKFQIEPKQIFRTKTPMKLGYMFAVAEKVPESMKRSLIYPPFHPQEARMLRKAVSRSRLKKKDICCLIHMKVWSRF